MILEQNLKSHAKTIFYRNIIKLIKVFLLITSLQALHAAKVLVELHMN